MVSDSELVDRIREILRTSDLNVTTPGTVRRQLQVEFGVDLSDRKKFITQKIDEILESGDINVTQDENVNEQLEDDDVGKEEKHEENEEEEEAEAEEEEEAEEEVEEEEEEEGESDNNRSKKNKKRCFFFQFMPIFGLNCYTINYVICKNFCLNVWFFLLILLLVIL